MLKIQNPYLDMKKCPEKVFTLSDFPIGFLKIVPTKDNHCHLAIDVFIDYEDGVDYSKTLKILTDSNGLAYMEVPNVDEQNFREEECFSPFKHTSIMVGDRKFISNTIFGFEAERFINYNYSPEESVFKFSSIPLSLFGENAEKLEGSMSYINPQGVGLIAQYVQTHQKDIAKRLDKVAEVLIKAPAQKYNDYYENYMKVFNAYNRGVGTYSDFLLASARFGKLMSLRESSKPINLNIEKMLEKSNEKEMI